MADFRTEITADRTQYDAAMDAAAAKAMSTGQAMGSAMREASVKMQAAFKEANDSANKQFDGIKAAVEKVRGVFALIAAVVGGGSLFGKMITSTKEMTTEVNQLARMLGVTSEYASALRSALNVNGIETESYTTMVSKLTIKLRENEERFNDLGIKTRGANGELLNGEQIMQNSLQTALKFKEGTDRNLVSTELFGRGWNEVVKLFKVTPEAIEAARVRMQDLETEIGPEGVARARAYGVAWKELKEVGEALANRVGQALMPVLTELAGFFSSMGPAAVVVMRGAIGGLVSIFWGLAMAAVTAFQLIKSAIYTIVEPLAAVAEAFVSVQQGKWSEAGDRMKQVGQNLSASWQGSFEEIMKQGDKTRKALGDLFDPQAEQGKSPAPKGGQQYEAKDSGKSRVSQWDAELAAMRDAYDKMKLEQGSFETYTKQQESAFWKDKIELTKEGTTERAEAEKKYYAVEREIRKVGFDAQVADINLRIAAHKAGSVQRIQLAGEEAALIGQKYGLQSAQYKKALEEMNKYAVERGKQQRDLENIELAAQKNYQLSRVELERNNIETLEQLGQITARQKLEALKNLKEIEFQIELDSMQRQAQNYQNDEIEYQKHLERIGEMKNKHEVEMKRIDNQIKVESFKVWREIGDQITSSFSTAIKGVIMGTQTLTQAMRNMAQNILLALIDMGVKWIAQQIINAAIGQTIEKTSAVSTITANAAVAATGAASSVSAIPYVGWMMAPGVAAETFAATEAWASVAAAAAGGFDIPAGVNPVTQLHQEEMVLPANIANPLRDAIDDGALGGAQHIHLHMIDTRGARQFIMDNRRSLADAAATHARENFSAKKR